MTFLISWQNGEENRVPAHSLPQSAPLSSSPTVGEQVYNYDQMSRTHIKGHYVHDLSKKVTQGCWLFTMLITHNAAKRHITHYSWIFEDNRHCS